MLPGCDGVTGYDGSAGFWPVFPEGTPHKSKKNFNHGSASSGTPGELIRQQGVTSEY
jgi:hypothetical protein